MLYFDLTGKQYSFAIGTLPSSTAFKDSASSGREAETTLERTDR